MKNLIIRLLFLTVTLHTVAQDKLTNNANDFNNTATKAWYVPDYVKMQFAGNIGFLSTGVGYKVYKDVLSTELLYGFVPSAVSKVKPIHLITLKNTFSIFKRTIGKDLTISPIAGFTATLETGNHSFLSIPEIYPDGYYVTNAIHFTLFAGASVNKKITNSKVFKSIDFYAELGTVETYLWYAITSKNVGLNDVFSAAIGINLYF